jgi:hypothetical protein
MGFHMMLSLGQAARLTGLGKTTITRSIKAGKLSAGRNDDGSYSIDPSELARVYPYPAPGSETPVTGDVTGDVVQDATPEESHELELRNAALEQEVRGLRELLEEVRTSRDQIASTLRSVVAALPPPTTSALSAPVRRGWFWRRAG